MFTTYFQLGLEHILDINGYDHILFILSIGIMYPLLGLKRILFLVTAFTIGHSLTLALAGNKLFSINPDMIESLIPITIIISCLDNIYTAYRNHNFSPKYITVLIFGLIHGLGFSNYFRSLLGKEESVLTPLFAFNIGVEAGQIAIILILLLPLLLLKNQKVARTVIIIASVVLLLLSIGLLF